MKKKNPIATEIIEKVEKEQFKHDINEVVDKLDACPQKLKNNYLKKTDINNFENYRTVISQLKNRTTNSSTYMPMSPQRGLTPFSDSQSNIKTRMQ